MIYSETNHWAEAYTIFFLLAGADGHFVRVFFFGGLIGEVDVAGGVW